MSIPHSLKKAFTKHLVGVRHWGHSCEPARQGPLSHGADSLDNPGPSEEYITCLKTSSYNEEKGAGSARDEGRHCGGR